MSSMELETLFPPRRGLKKGAEVVSLDIRYQEYLSLQDGLRAIIVDTIAEQTGGQSILLLDDTDHEALEVENPDHIFNMLSWLKMCPDEYRYIGAYGPYSWSERMHLYQAVINHMLEEELAYVCFCQPAFDDEGSNQCYTTTHEHKCCVPSDELAAQIQQPHTIRFRSHAPISLDYADSIYGHQHFETKTDEDFILFTVDKGKIPMPYFAHIVDNHFMRVTTHVRRSTDLEMVPQEILLSRALGWDMPKLVHVPCIDDPAVGKLFEEPQVDKFKEQGYYAETMINYLTQLTWKHPEERIVYPHEDFRRDFKIDDLARNTLMVDYKLLNRIQESYTMRRL